MDQPPRESPRLKALDLQGYKTFAGRAEFQFGRTITAIVGPNGSGKSNIADAIRWVLGEQSYGLLRGKKTEDMIFAGSETRPRASMASATITFDNGDGWLPIEFSEVTVSRRAYRDAQNEYYLNSQRVRLRDIFELLSETGLGQRTYTIIGQGLVDAVLALRAEERRRLFEEAAGIGLYRSRREEALRRLESTQHNLERVQDILAELLPRVRSLERQARRAHEYEQVRDDLKSALRTWYGFHWFRVQKQVTEAHAEAGQQAQRRDDLRAEQQGLDQLLMGSRGQIEALRAELHAFSQRMSARYAERETLGRRVAVAQERLRGLAEQDGVAKSETASLEAERDELLVRLAAARDETTGRQQTLFAAEEEFHRLQGPADLVDLDRDGLQERLAEARARLEAALERRSAWRSELAQADARLQSLAAQAAETRLGRDAALAGAGASRESAAGEQRAAEGTQRALQSARDAEQAIRQRLAELERALTEAQQGLRDAESVAATLDARRSALQDEATRPHRAPARLEQALKDGELSGAIGRLGAHVHPEASLRAAVMAALGESALGFVFRDQQAVDEALVWLAQELRTGRVDLLPQAMLGTPPTRLSAADCLGNAADLARPDEAVRTAVDHLLGQTLIAETREQARQIAAGLPAGSRVVTRLGEVFTTSGEVLVGTVEEGLPSEALAQVEAELAAAEADREAKAANAHTMRADVETARGSLSEASRLAEEAAGLDQTARLRVEQVGF